MNGGTGKAARRLATIGLFLVLALFLVWSVGADETRSGSDGGLVMYEVSLAGVESGRLEIAVPAGFEYAGLAAGSQVEVAPEISADRQVLAWQSPFSGAGVLRFWLAPLGAAEAPAALPVIGTGLEAVRVESPAPAPLGPVAAPPAIAPSAAISVEKSVDPEVVYSDISLWTTYEVEFETEGDQPVTLDRVTDTLPLGFWIGGMAAGTDVITPPVQINDTDWVWQNLTFTESLTLRYNAKAVSQPGVYHNSVVALSGGDLTDPASASLEVVGPDVQRTYLPIVVRNYTVPLPVWQVQKSADPTEVEVDGTVNYTVVIANVGTLAGTVGSVADTLPDGFTFLGMGAASDVINPPVGFVGTISWQGPWTVQPGGDLTLVYEVQTSGLGEKSNLAVAYGAAGEKLGSASALVTIGGGLPYVDDFAQGLSADWQPFTNYAGLSADRWYWAGTVGVYGLYNYEWDRVEPGNTGYDLTVYNPPGAQNWTDYRIEVRLKDVKETGSLKSGLSGIFFRGTYEPSGAMDGKTVGGYYIYLKAPNDTLYLMRTPPSNPSFAAAQVVKSYYYSPRIGLKHWYKLVVEVRGNNIKAWFEDDEDGVSNAVEIFNWTDTQNAWPAGTVGFATYYTSTRYDYIHVTALP